MKKKTSWNRRKNSYVRPDHEKLAHRLTDVRLIAAYGDILEKCILAQLENLSRDEFDSNIHILTQKYLRRVQQLSTNLYAAYAGESRKQVTIEIPLTSPLNEMVTANE